MAKISSNINISNNLYTNNTSIANGNTTNSGIFNANTLSGSAINIDYSGKTKIDKLVLADEETGREWQITISNGKLKAIPLNPIDIRDQKISSIIDDNN